MNLENVLDILEYEGNICSYLHRMISGREFKNIFAGYTFVKLTNNDDECNYADEKMDMCQLDEYIDKSEGIYFTDLKNMWKQIAFRSFGVSRSYDYRLCVIKYMRKVMIPNDAKVYIDVDRFKIDKLFLCQKEKINKEIYMKAVKNNHRCLECVPTDLRDNDMYLTALKQISMTSHY